MALIIPSTDVVQTTVQVQQQVQAASKEIVFHMSDFKNTVGYIVIDTLDSNGDRLASMCCKVEGMAYMALIAQQKEAGMLAEILVSALTDFVNTADMENMDVTHMTQGEMLQDIALLVM